MSMVENSANSDTKGAVTSLTLPAREGLVFTGMNTYLVAVAVWANRMAVPANPLKMGNCSLLVRPSLHDFDDVHGISPSLSTMFSI